MSEQHKMIEPMRLGRFVIVAMSELFHMAFLVMAMMLDVLTNLKSLPIFIQKQWILKTLMMTHLSISKATTVLFRLTHLPLREPLNILEFHVRY